MKWYTLAGLALLASCSSSDNPTSTEPGTATELSATPGDNQPSFDEGQTIINRDNHVAVVAAAFDALTGRDLQTRLQQIPYLPTQFGGVSNFENLSDETYACDNGGTASIVTFAGLFSSTYDVSFDNCQVDADVLTGPLIVVASGESVTYNSPNNLQVQFGSQAAMAFSGKVKIGCCESTYDQEWETEELNYQLQENGALTAIANAESSFTDGEESSFRSAFLDGSLALTTQATFNQTVTVTVDETFAFDSAAGLNQTQLSQLASTWAFTQGKLTISAADNSMLVLDANSGAADTVRVTITTGDSSATFDQPWSEWKSGLVKTN